MISSDQEAVASLNRDLLRIAYCMPKLTGGADLLQQRQIAAGLQARGHHLTFISSLNLSDTVCTNDLQVPALAPRTWSNSAWFNIAKKITWRVQQWVRLPYLNFFSNYSLYDACLQCLPGHDLVHERNGLYRMGVAMACKRLKLPYVLFFDADDIFEHDFLGESITGILLWRAKQIIKYTLTAADGIVTVSDATKARLVNVWQVPQEKIVVFPNGVDVHRFMPNPEKRAETRTSLGVCDAPVITYVGNFYPWHDVAALIEAFASVLKVYPKACLMLVGDGEQRQVMVQHTAALGIRHAVHFTGLRPHDEIPHLMSSVDIAVAPYPKMEQAWWMSSMKLFEYFASGVAVIASNVGEQVAQVIRDGENGLLVTPGDIPELANALIRLIEDPALRSRLGQQAREDAVNKYSWERYLTRLESVYHAVMEKRPIHMI